MILKPPKGVLLNRGHPLSRGLVGFWLFNEGSGSKVLDLSGNGKNGSFSGSPIWDSGKYGPNVHFDPANNDQIDCGDIEIGSGPHTIIISFKLDVLRSFNCLVSKTNGSYANPVDIWINSVGDLRYYLSEGTVSGNYIVLSGLFLANKQYFLAAWYDGTNQGVIVNGTDSGSESASLSIADGDTSFRIGRRDDGATEMDGVIDFVLVYNRALSASEIVLLYREPFAMFERDPIELWVGSVGAVISGLSIPIAMHHYKQMQGVA